jgi:hypothetical protein
MLSQYTFPVLEEYTEMPMNSDLNNITVQTMKKYAVKKGIRAPRILNKAGLLMKLQPHWDNLLQFSLNYRGKCSPQERGLVTRSLVKWGGRIEIIGSNVKFNYASF